MASVLKTLLDSLSSKISVNTSDITEINNRLNDVDSGVTLEEYITTNNSNISKLQSDLQSVGTDISSIESDVAEISSGLTSVRSEVETARGGSASLDARLDAMTTATENAQSDASTAQTTANEAATSANTANTNIAVAAEPFDSLKARLDDMTTATENAQSDASTAQTTANEAATSANTANTNIAVAAEPFDSLKARLDDMTTATENAQSDASTAQTTANEAATSANTANTNIAVAAEPFDSLKARLDDMTTDITNVTDAADTATTDIANINAEISVARLGFTSLSYAVRAASFSGFGKALNTSSQAFWLTYTSSKANYYTAAGELTTSDNPNAAYTIAKVDNFPITLVISIANILTVTSDILLPSSLAPITLDGVIYNIYFIRLPNMEFDNRYALNSSFLNSFPVIAGSSDQLQITMDMIGNTNSTGAVSLTTKNANLYIPVLRPKTSPGTVFKFLYTAIDPDTNTVQYLTYNSQITVFL